MLSESALIVAVAIAGKLSGCVVAARTTGMAWRDAMALGALMNTRGLIELGILNIGLDLGVISQRLFSMMVFMALATTFMATPLLRMLPILMLTPFFRVAASVFYFMIALKNWKYTLFTGFVLAVLTYSLFLR
jgi:Kef-type K+ transport system membrane component KefB